MDRLKRAGNRLRAPDLTFAFGIRSEILDEKCAHAHATTTQAMHMPHMRCTCYAHAMDMPYPHTCHTCTCPVCTHTPCEHRMVTSAP